MKRLLSILLVGIMCMSISACGGMDVKEELIAENWYNKEEPFSVSLEFYETGTGSQKNILKEGSLGFEWSEIEGVDDSIRIKYTYTGAVSDYKLVNEDGILMLKSVDGDTTYVRESDLDL